jgi:hypothetical protein
MATMSRFLLNSVCVLGGVVAYNSSNGNSTDFLNAGIFSVGISSFFATCELLISRTIEYLRVKRLANEKQIVEDGFNIKNYDFTDSKVIGHFHGQNIYEQIKVIFENGYIALYEFCQTVDDFKDSYFDVDSIHPGSLILNGGIIYKPVI